MVLCSERNTSRAAREPTLQRESFFGDTKSSLDERYSMAPFYLDAKRTFNGGHSVH
ncbi:hypothetical protein ACVWZZ_005798 [Bradyrhizobium sp. LM6.10]